MCIPTKLDSRSNPGLLELHLDTSRINYNETHDLIHQPRSHPDRKDREEEHVTTGRIHKMVCIFLCCFVLALSIRMRNEANNMKLEHDRVKAKIRDLQTRLNRTRKMKPKGLEYTQQQIIEPWWENENAAMVSAM